MITWNHSLHTRYSNFLIIIDLASVQCEVQCVSSTTCERVFNVHNLIKMLVEICLEAQI